MTKKPKKPHICANKFYGEGAKGGCFFDIEESEFQEAKVYLRVGWSCVNVCDQKIPITWLSEVIAIATSHKDGIAGFLQEHNYGGGYALKCDPPPKTTKKDTRDDCPI